MLHNFAQHILPLAGTVPGEFGGVPLRENVPGIFLLPRAGGHQLVHGLMMGHSCHINDETMVSFRPCSLSNVFLR